MIGQSDARASEYLRRGRRRLRKRSPAPASRLLPEATGVWCKGIPDRRQSVAKDLSGSRPVPAEFDRPATLLGLPPTSGSRLFLVGGKLRLGDVGRPTISAVSKRLLFGGGFP